MKELLRVYPGVVFAGGCYVLLTVALIYALGHRDRPVVELGPRFDPGHAAACRALHSIARTKRQRAEAVLACRQPNPSAWLHELRVEVRGPVGLPEPRP